MLTLTELRPVPQSSSMTKLPIRTFIRSDDGNDAHLTAKHPQSGTFDFWVIPGTLKLHRLDGPALTFTKNDVVVFVVLPRI